MESSPADLQRARLLTEFPGLWSRMIAEWRQPGTEDRAWLMYSANYLFRTGGVRWAMDPLRLSQRLPEAPAVDAAGVLSGLSFVLLTHAHKDHLDLGLIDALREQPIRWVVPSHMVSLLERQAGLLPEQILVPQNGMPFELFGLRITPFNGLHWEPAGLADADGNIPMRGLPSTGYLVESDGKRWLFPGDTREYRAAALPLFGAVDVLFAHLWLGRGRALEPDPPLLESFCRFCMDLQPRHILLTHLHELGRAATDYWDGKHAARVCCHLSELAPDIKVHALLTGESMSL